LIIRHPSKERFRSEKKCAAKRAALESGQTRPDSGTPRKGSRSDDESTRGGKKSREETAAAA